MIEIFNNDRPIYIQLVEQLKLDIISGKFKVGERLPSVRDLALQIKINPNTVQKALSELENAGLIYTERTNGKYITDNKNLIEQAKHAIIIDNINTYFKNMEKLGMQKKEAIKFLEELGGK